MTDQTNQAGEYDLSKAIQTMRAFGLDPSSNDAYLFGKAWVDDVDRNAPGAADRYTRAAQQAANLKVQFEAMRNTELFDPKLANDPGVLWEIAQLKAAPPHTEQPKPGLESITDISDISDPGVLFEISKAKGLV